MDDKKQNIEEEGSGIDLKRVQEFAAQELKPDPFYKRFGWGLLTLLIRLLLLILELVIDILKGLWTVISGIFIYSFKFLRGIYRTVKNAIGIFREVDGAGKGSFLIMGIGQFKYGQIVDAIVYFAVEVVFVVWFAFAGYSALVGLSLANPPKNLGSQVPLIAGILSIIVVLAFVVVYYFSIKGMHDDYIILHELEFKNSKLDAIYVMNHEEKFDIDLRGMSKHAIYKAMRDQYGYSKMSATEISKVPFSRMNAREANPVAAFFNGIIDKIYVVYNKKRNVIKVSSWSSVFAHFLDWEMVEKPSKYGYEVVLAEVNNAYLSFKHTYDKYNDYYATVRDTKALLVPLADPHKIIDAVYARDKVSVSNNVTPITDAYIMTDKKGNQATIEYKFTVKNIVSRIVGAFDLSFDIAKQVSKIYVRARKLSKLSKDPQRSSLNKSDGSVDYKACKGAAVEDIISAHYRAYSSFLQNFIENNHDTRIKRDDKKARIYENYSAYLPLLGNGKSTFVSSMVYDDGLTKAEALKIYGDFAHDRARYKNDESKMGYSLLTRGAHIRDEATANSKVEFHGQPMRIKKKARQYVDEKFAVTVLALPVIGSIMVSIVPLIFSILIAFTNWDTDHKNRLFGWDLSAWGNIFNIFGSSNGEVTLAHTFIRVLTWTIVWAIFATFTNYIFGIILALLINRKGIRLKKMWRTVFVITIAIPQFITLLCMSKLLSEVGPVNTWLLSKNENGQYINTWYTQGIAQWFGFGKWAEDGTFTPQAWPFLADGVAGDITNSAGEIVIHNFWPKLTCIVVNIWVGVPYTMLSTSGILMNIPDDLYESSQIDGAGAWKQFWSITMPYVLFVTGPYLLTQFIGNINNFNVIFFLTGGGPTGGDLLNPAGGTSLLITWIYNISTGSQNQFSIASVLGCLIFALCGFFSIIAYGNLGSVKNEEEFQ